MTAVQQRQSKRWSIPTVYQGTQFRSKLEAEWAQFFDAYGIPYEYEPRGFVTEIGFALPDFWLSRGEQFFEVKGRWTQVEDEKFAALARELAPIALVLGGPRGIAAVYSHSGSLEPAATIFCNRCETVIWQATPYPFFPVRACSHCASDKVVLLAISGAPLAAWPRCAGLSETGPTHAWYDWACGFLVT
jgi:hypothetical protein